LRCAVALEGSRARCHNPVGRAARVVETHFIKASTTERSDSAKSECENGQFRKTKDLTSIFRLEIEFAEQVLSLLAVCP